VAGVPSGTGKGRWGALARGAGGDDHLSVRAGFKRRLGVCGILAAGVVGLVLLPAPASGGHSPRSGAGRPLAGDLDPLFGSNGIATANFIGIDATAVQPDGKILVVGTGGSLSLARYLADGSLDPSFGEGGYVETNLFPSAVALQPDGKIVVAGAAGGGLGEFALARYNPDGSLDTSFGTGGITYTEFPEPEPPGVPRWSYANALALLPNGDIVAGGVAEVSGFPDNTYFALARYTPDGLLDQAFGEGGTVQTSFTGYDGPAGIAVQPDGKIVAGGSSYGGGHGNYQESISIARYQSDGSLDPTFGKAGKVFTAPKLNEEGDTFALRHGKIVMAGVTMNDSDTAIKTEWVARFRASGQLDSSFGHHGFASIRGFSAPPGDPWILRPNGMLMQQDGKIVIGLAHSIVRLLPHGGLDPSFGKRGVATPPPGAPTRPVAMQGGDQKILVAGWSNPGYGPSTLARLIGGNNCVVPALRGRTLAKATATLAKSYCSRGPVSKRFSSSVRRGRVISTAPHSGSRLPGGAKVKLLVSRGKSNHSS
jgi:uncharacterized delta-60 repeat protein